MIDFYDNITGDWYNNLPLEKQLEVLHKHYPIGYIFHWKQPDAGRPESREFYKNHTCKINGYVEVGKNGNRWFILNVTNLDPKTINIRQGMIKEDIHPGLLRPGVWQQRVEKLSKLGIW